MTDVVPSSLPFSKIAQNVVTGSNDVVEEQAKERSIANNLGSHIYGVPKTKRFLLDHGTQLNVFQAG